MTGDVMEEAITNITRRITIITLSSNPTTEITAEAPSINMMSHHKEADQCNQLEASPIPVPALICMKDRTRAAIMKIPTDHEKAQFEFELAGVK
jgi:hypothetical protein